MLSEMRVSGEDERCMVESWTDDLEKWKLGREQQRSSQAPADPLPRSINTASS
jgi:hypothetical protein